MAPRAKRRRDPGPIGRAPEDRRGEYARARAKQDQNVGRELLRRTLAVPTTEQVAKVARSRQGG